MMEWFAIIEGEVELSVDEVLELLEQLLSLKSIRP